MIFRNRFYRWAINEVEQIKPHTLEIMNFIKPRPDYLIIGTGSDGYQFHPAFFDHFRKMGIKIGKFYFYIFIRAYV